MSKPRNKKYNPNKHRSNFLYRSLDRLTNGADSIRDHRYDYTGMINAFNRPIIMMIEKLRNGGSITADLNEDGDGDIIHLKRLYILTYAYADMLENGDQKLAKLAQIKWVRDWLDTVFSKALHYIITEDVPEGYDYMIHTDFGFTPLSTTVQKLIDFMDSFMAKICGMPNYIYAEHVWNGAKLMQAFFAMEDIEKPFKKLIDIKPFMEQLETVFVETGYMDK